MDNLDLPSQPVSRLQLLSRCEEVIQMISTARPSAFCGSTNQQIWANQMGSVLAYIEQMVVMLRRSKGITDAEMLIRQRDYRIIAVAWLDLQEEIARYTLEDGPLPRRPLLMKMGPMLVLDPLLIMLNLGTELDRNGVRGNARVQKLESQALLERNRRKAVIEIMSGVFADVQRRVMDCCTQINFMKRALIERFEDFSVRVEELEEVGKPSTMNLARIVGHRPLSSLMRLIEALRAEYSLESLVSSVRDSQNEHGDAVRKAASVRVHGLETGLPAMLRAQSSMLS